jgi:hypothetical protein
MTVVTAIYQIPYIANSSFGDALALSIGLIIFLVLMAAPWIPGLNSLPRHLLIHRLIWYRYYADHHEDHLPERSLHRPGPEGELL